MVKGRVARFTLLDRLGAPLEGDRSVVTTKGVVKITIGEIVEDQSNQMLRNEADRPRILFHGRPKTMGYSLDFDLCGVDPDLISMLTGYPVVHNAAGDIVGNDALSRLPLPNFAVEVWTKLAQPVDGYSYGYTLFPRVNGGRVASFSVEPQSADFVITGSRTRPMPRWDVGPYWLNNVDPSCAGRPPLVPELLGPFGSTPFGSGPFGGGSGGEIDPLSPRLLTPVGSKLGWRTMLLASAPEPVCGAQPLYDVIDGGTASTTTADVVDGEFIYTSPDIISGGRA